MPRVYVVKIVCRTDGSKVFIALSKMIETDSFARCGFLQNFYEKIGCRQNMSGKVNIDLQRHTKNPVKFCTLTPLRIKIKELHV